MYKILIVEDDQKIAQLLSNHLLKFGYEPILVDDFDQIDDLFLKHSPHVVLLDINLPKYDGYYWCKRIRQLSSCPIIFVSARIGEMDQVMAIEYGADDFITKPFSYDIVMAKIKSQIRRSYGEFSATASSDKEREILFHGLILYPERLELHFRDQKLFLVKKEMDMLDLLIGAYPRAVKRNKLLEHVWDEQLFIGENTLNVYIARLRKKLQELEIDHAIETVKGVGYRIHVTWEENVE
ncbi:DNA-binding response OmpR family regulator [Croceifilum oryzae]|uniref:DNA-binding response OmpR family regulator n=1 Tax=Croceifilum oryzae TaxID=1553429 RepID=A0AAJ1WSI0_9BACL|nr:response regulator transcription factor [Croceifilum oryzae]MDQ0415976.1 DNA-binding response OmpR family regulator [Croceifilum oryzae]